MQYGRVLMNLDGEPENFGSEDLRDIGADKLCEVESEDGVRTFRMKSEEKNRLRELIDREDVVWGDFSESPNKERKEKGHDCT